MQWQLLLVISSLAHFVVAHGQIITLKMMQTYNPQERTMESQLLSPRSRLKEKTSPPFSRPGYPRTGKKKKIGGERVKITGGAVPTLTLFFLKGPSFLEAKSPSVCGVN